MRKLNVYIPGTRKKGWGLISKIPILDLKGNIAGIVGTIVNITERKIAENTRIAWAMPLTIFTNVYGLRSYWI